jgi:hypothetical protein
MPGLFGTHSLKHGLSVELGFDLLKVVAGEIRLILRDQLDEFVMLCLNSNAHGFKLELERISRHLTVLGRLEHFVFAKTEKLFY